MGIQKLIVILCTLSIPCMSLADRDVYVNGYTRSDGTYVRPHIRKSPDPYKWNNYGPSRSDSELMNPTQRDNDRDGTSNYTDSDDDNDLTHDDIDKTQYDVDRSQYHYFPSN